MFLNIKTLKICLSCFTKKYKLMEMIKINKKLTMNFGLGANTSEKIHKQLGLNCRKSPIFIKKKHKEKIEQKFIKNKTGKDLKQQINDFKCFKKKLRTHIKTQKIAYKIKPKKK